METTKTHHLTTTRSPTSTTYLHKKTISADYTDSYVTMEEELTCPVCLELFADPLMLPCSHSICKRCLQDILASRRKSFMEGFDCPSCRKKSNLSPEQLLALPRNLSLENVVFRYQEIRSSTMTKSRSLDLSSARERSHPTRMRETDAVCTDGSVEKPISVGCDLCDVDESVGVGSATPTRFWCRQCRVSYCGVCVEKYHPPIGVFARHSVERGAVGVSRPGSCKDHVGNDSSIFCLSCHVGVCHLCVCHGVGKHVSHKIVDQEMAAEQIKKTASEVKVEILAMNEKLAEQNSQLDKLGSGITKLFADVTGNVHNQREAFLSDIMAATEAFTLYETKRMISTRNERTARINALQEENTQSAQTLESYGGACKQLLSEGDVGGLLNSVEGFRGVTEGLEVVRESVIRCETKSRDLHTEDETSREVMRSYVGDFTDGLRRIMYDVLNTDAVVPRIVPLFQTANSPGKTDSLNVHNKSLMTWGFKSTTFTANFVETSASWTINIERNTSSIGDQKTGYLFGAGISPESLTVKDLVGLSRSSCGVVCDKGKLFYSCGGERRELCPLDRLPLVVRLSVEPRREFGYTVFRFVVSDPDWRELISGDRVIFDEQLVQAYRPVFSVSQRVRMLLSA